MVLMVSLLFVSWGCESGSPFEPGNGVTEEQEFTHPDDIPMGVLARSMSGVAAHMGDDCTTAENPKSGFNIKNGMYSDDDSLIVIYKP